MYSLFSLSRQAALFTVTAFFGAVLLFWIQPLFAKMALPLLGGSALVWNTAMVFYQAMLLVGYAYAHVLTRLLAPRRQLGLHAVVLALAAVALPVGIADHWQPDAGVPPAAWLLALLFTSLGAPFVALAATAPLLQRWFSLGRHPQAHNPYFLYAASNAGSVAVVFAFPFILEPLLSTEKQSLAWAAGFAALALGVLACGFAVLFVRSGESADPAPAPQHGTVDWRRRSSWLAYSAVPAALLLGVTGHISTDIAPAPLLWVVPLALYLLSFVNAFARKPPIPHWLSGRAAAFATVLLAAVFLWREPAGVFLPLHLLTLFAVALAVHGELARRRPPAGELTEFYLFVSLGGLAGGALVALVAPVVFDRVLEYPLSLALAAALLPRRDGEEASRPGVRLSDFALPALIASIALGLSPLFDWVGIPLHRVVYGAVLATLAIFALSRQGRPVAFAACIAALLSGAVLSPWRDPGIWTGRSFYGVYRVVEGDDPRTRSLVHGSTNHGGQWMPDDGTVRPTTYHTPTSPVVDVINAMRAARGGLRVGVAGVGAGALAYYRAPGDEWRYYEIDPLIEWLATQSGHFQILPRHDPNPTVVLGDARLGLAREPDSYFDLLIMDAFASDAVPTHLLTHEAIAMYMSKLAPGGVVALHISNRLLDLEPVVAGAVAELGYAGRLGRRADTEPELDPTGVLSHWAIVARNDAALDALALTGTWHPVDLARQQHWRDDHSNLVGIIRWTGR